MSNGRLSPGAEVAKEGVLAILGAIFWDLIKTFFRNSAHKGGEIAAEKLTKKFAERRDEMLSFIRGLVSRGGSAKRASQNLIKRWEKRQKRAKKSYRVNGKVAYYKPYDEAIFAERITKLYTSLDEKGERKARIEIFIWIGNMSDEEFDLFLEFLNHDIVIQFLRRSWEWLKWAWPHIYCSDLKNPGLYQQFKEKLGVAKATKKLAKVNRGLKNSAKREKGRGLFRKLFLDPLRSPFKL
ncbi:hypothetical protein HY227_01480 [Candidatus Wolfebacteria bacterium]|nr:hypothetical protein [Candidatus Wolfebacteria bacterium]